MFHEHRPIPNHGKHEPQVFGIARYYLTDVEKALVNTDKQHLIANAEDRGIKPDPVVYQTKVATEVHTGEKRKRIDAPKILTKEFLEGAMKERKTVNMIVQETGISYSTIIKYLRIHDVANTSQKKRKSGPQPIAKGRGK